MKNRILVLILLAAVVGLLAAPFEPDPMRTSDPSWTSIGPDGGSLLDLEVNPANSNDLLAVFLSTPAQVYRTTNGGRSWKRIGLFDDAVIEVAFGPPGSGRIYAMSQSSLYRSRNGGSSWATVAPPQGFSSLDRLASHPSNADGLYILGQMSGKTASLGVARTMDGGQTWRSTRVSPEADLVEGYSLRVHSGSPSVMYISGYYRTSSTACYAVFRTTNGGVSWQDITGGIATKVYDLATDPGNPSKVYAATEWNVYRSADAGLTWLTGTSYAYGYGLAVDPANPSIIYAGYQKRIYKSTDGGVYWIAIGGNFNGDCRRMAIAGNAVFFGSNTGVYRSTDAGLNWAPGQTGVRAGLVPSFYASPSNPNVLYANISRCGFLRSQNFGRSWTLLPYFYSCDDQGRIAAVDPGDPQTLYMIAPGEG